MTHNNLYCFAEYLISKFNSVGERQCEEHDNDPPREIRLLDTGICEKYSKVFYFYQLIYTKSPQAD